MAAATASGRRSWIGSLLWLALAGCAAALIASGASLRGAAIALLERAGLADAPEVRATALVMPGPEDAASYAADSVLAGLAPGSPASERDAATADRAALLDGSRSLALDGLADSPGGTPQRVAVGRAAYAIWEREPSPGSERGWERTLAIAAHGAPGFDFATDALASASLGAWPRLSEPGRTAAREAVAAGFRSPAYVRRALPTALAALGPEEAMKLLPHERAPLEAAAAVLRALGRDALAEQAAAAASALPPASASAAP
jgi:hypothetical protein